ncbi:IMPACT family protein [Noviherbaspirillum pedocola]|uniref:YigZ family protein n=1 Tax=Noviherbaspirillum pedocola TaxID=2801341 RepID=A0A934T039_9BURK|nr:YigZ family protein [Noviherbaspirillum pedocola]MBK4738889.1 YigZ family protein [Noviherbaspirillum pedocola]
MPSHTLAAAAHAEIEIRKSRFIALAVPVEDRAAALAIVDALRAQHPGAAHVCWALLAGGHSGMSDDGEPSGTAGRPILEVLRHHELDGVLGAVVRYFGGVKLGAGGLVRAYTDAIAAALKGAERIVQVPMATLTVEVDYASEARVRRWLAQQGYLLAGSSHGVLARLEFRLPALACDVAREDLRNLTAGHARFPEN